MSVRGRWLGTFGSMVIGAIIAAVTIVGVVSHTVNSSSKHVGNVNASIPYGSTQ